MQRMISHPQPLPPCAAGHSARHMHDQRAPRAGGGRFIECACSHTPRSDTFAQALAHWRQAHDHQVRPQRPRVIPLRAGGAGGSL